MAKRGRNQRSVERRRRATPERKPETEATPGGGATPFKALDAVLLAVGAVAAAATSIWFFRDGFGPETIPEPPVASVAARPEPRSYDFNNGRLVLWWEEVPEAERRSDALTAWPSNVCAEDYAGPESCRRCHQTNHDGWSRHPHRWMNAQAGPQTVLGDFQDREIAYLGGRGTFTREGSGYRMTLVRDGTRRVYEITQTLGSRFFQYYIGRMLEGPEPRDHKFRREEHVLPFGYWIEPGEWVPTVHVGPELPDGERSDPFEPPEEFPFYSVYAKNCSQCHSTYPLADWVLRKPELACMHVPVDLHMDMVAYLREAHPEYREVLQDPWVVPEMDVVTTLSRFGEIKEVAEHAVSFGITCEACHYGSRAHAEGEIERPAFFPVSPFVHGEAGTVTDLGRTDANVNWTCGRCHTGQRPQFAGGMSTWNSTEYSDMMRGACASEITCIDCHNPHEAIGRVWTRPPAEDDASCLQCHSEYRQVEARQAHTHHAPGSEGDRCMNCHMPRLNEGMQDLVRTHTISSPTNAAMIEANHPNACNMCHADWPLGRTLDTMRLWYGVDAVPATPLTGSSSDPRSALLEWLESENEAVRLVAADSLIRADARWALPQLLESLDDPYLLNRQFARRGLESWLGVSLEDSGYRFYMTPEERRQPLARLREQLLGNGPDAGAE